MTRTARSKSTSKAVKPDDDKKPDEKAKTPDEKETKPTASKATTKKATTKKATTKKTTTKKTGGRKKTSTKKTAVPASVVSSIRKIGAKKGFGDIFKAGDEAIRVPTQFKTFNTALGGGIMQGRIVEFYGPNHTGRTTFSVQIVGHMQKPGELSFFMDYEQTFLPDHARICTANRLNIVHLEDLADFLETAEPDHPPTMVWCQPMTLEEGCNTLDELIPVLSGHLKYVIIDSVAAMSPSALANADTGDSLPAIRARLLSPYWETRSKLFQKHLVTVIAINQERDKVGGNGGWQTGPQTYTVGGKALMYYASQRVKFGSGETTGWESVLPHGNHSAYLDIMKNKCKGTRRMKTRLVLWPGRGFSPEIEMIDLCKEQKVLKQVTGGFTYTKPDGTDSPKVTRKNLLSGMVSPGGDKIYELFEASLIKKVGDGYILFDDFVPKHGLDFASLLLDEDQEATEG